MDYVLKVNSLSKSYGHYKALSNLSLNIPKGSIYGFVGRNGAGKTTLIRIICGLQQPSSGNYILYDRKNTDLNIVKSRKRVGAVIETPSIYLNMTAEENLKQQYYVLGIPSFDGLYDILKLVSLENTGKKKVKDFSLGMRQRLGIAIALVGNPDFLILDEPTNGLDPQGIIEIRELILKLNHERQITFLISSHILEELSKLATHYGFIDHGHIVKEIDAKELQATFRNSIRMKVTNVSELVHVLDKMNIEYNIISDQEVDVFEDINVTQLVLALESVNCEVFSMYKCNESLESYYINLVGGGIYE